MLEAPAFAELLAYFSYDAFGALGLIEERSYAFDKLGQQVFDERFSLADDALDPRGLPKAFDFEGTPKQRVELVQDGVLSGVVWDRASAKRAGGGQRDDRPRAAELAAPLGPARRSRSRSPAARRTRPSSWRSWSATGSTSRASTT